MILRDSLTENIPTAEKKWTFDRVWIASTAFTYFVYEWWSHMKNWDDPTFLRAANAQIFATADEIVGRIGGDREAVIDVVRSTYPQIRDAVLKLDPGRPHTAGSFAMALHAILLRIALTDQSLVDKAVSLHSGTMLGTIMVETAAALDSVKRS